MLLWRDKLYTPAHSASFTLERVRHPAPLLCAIVEKSSCVDGGGRPGDLYEHRLSDANSDGVTKMVADKTHLFNLVIFEFSEVIGQ